MQKFQLVKALTYAVQKEALKKAAKQPFCVAFTLL